MRASYCGQALVGVVLIGCTSIEVARSEQAVTYNGDSRQQYYEATPAWQSVSERTAIMVDAENIHFQSDGMRVLDVGNETLGASQHLCGDQRYLSEPTTGSCSGTLVGPKQILTAGHCVAFTRGGCTSLGWVFGFRYDAAGQLHAPTDNDIYTCRQVIAGSFRGVDYALLELDRDVVGRTPATLRTETNVALRDLVTLIGYPSGIPVKIDIEGAVMDISSSTTSFGATVDAFGGNSGSGVFDTEGRVVGVLTAGERDYVARGACNIVNDVACTSDCEGENVVRATAIFADACRRGVSILGTCPVIPVSEAGVETSVTDAGRRDAGARDTGVTTLNTGVILGGGGCNTSRRSPSTFAVLLALVVLSRLLRSGSRVLRAHADR